MADAKTVLIIEDDEFLRSIAAKRLEKEGYVVKDAADGDAGVAAVEAGGINVVLLDLLLPTTDGYEVLRRLRASAAGKELPILVFSNLGQKEEIEKAMQLGATDFLVKANFTLDDVAGKVAEHLK